MEMNQNCNNIMKRKWAKIKIENAKMRRCLERNRTSGSFTKSRERSPLYFKSKSYHVVFKRA